jgi:hypothetical protein
LVSYFKSSGIITTLKKHMNVEHGLIAKNFEDEVNNNTKTWMEKTFVRKMPKIIEVQSLTFWGLLIPLNIMYIKNNSYRFDYSCCQKSSTLLVYQEYFIETYDNAKLWALCMFPSPENIFSISIIEPNWKK